MPDKKPAKPPFPLTDADRRVASVIIPIVCYRCGATKRNADGQTLCVSMHWQRGKRMVCPACHEAEKTMKAMEDVVWDDDDEVPF